LDEGAYLPSKWAYRQVLAGRAGQRPKEAIAVAARTRPSTRDVIAVGASAGGVEALRVLVAALPPGLPASMLVVLHLPRGGTSALAVILDRVGSLPVGVAQHGAMLRHGVVHVAPPDHHLLVEGDHLILTDGASEGGYRPGINALFRSVAASAGSRAIGVLLSGNLDDGVAGLCAIAQRGGMTLVQTPADALHPAMPRNALRSMTVDHVVPAWRMGTLLGELAVEESGELIGELDPLLTLENRLAEGVADEPWKASGQPCPACQRSLLDACARRYRCAQGEEWSAETLWAQETGLRHALETALRALDEKVSLALRLAEVSMDRGSRHLAQRYANLAEETTLAVQTLRAHLTRQRAAEEAAHGDRNSGREPDTEPEAGTTE
jgi:two-component system chemotaxis response regulator CheB